MGASPTRITACLTSVIARPEGFSATEVAMRTTLAESSGSAVTMRATSSSATSGFIDRLHHAETGVRAGGEAQIVRRNPLDVRR